LTEVARHESARKRQKGDRRLARIFALEHHSMALRAATGLALSLAASAAFAAPSPLPLASHRAAYDLSLADPASRLGSLQTPVAATGMIAYEFHGSSCDGYTAEFRQMTRMQRSEGEPLSTGVTATSFESGDGKSMRFEVEPQGQDPSPTVAGTANRETGDDLRVQLTKPSSKAIDFGRDVLFPTQHIERLIDAGQKGERIVQARVYDGSETGAKIFATLAIVGKAAGAPGVDNGIVGLKDVPRWPVVVSYFDEASKESTPDYTLSFDLYENGVSGSLKLDYGQFALNAKLKSLEILPTPACAK
jgi:hypothetical protein